MRLPTEPPGKADCERACPKLFALVGGGAGKGSKSAAPNEAIRPDPFEYENCFAAGLASGTKSLSKCVSNFVGPSSMSRSRVGDGFLVSAERRAEDNGVVERYVLSKGSDAPSSAVRPVDEYAAPSDPK